jgi:hypothetical protein
VSLNKLFSFFLSLWLYSPLDLGRFSSFVILYTVSWTSWTGDQPVVRPLPIHRTTQIQTFMPRVGLESMTPVFERMKTVMLQTVRLCERPLNKLLIRKWVNNKGRHMIKSCGKTFYFTISHPLSLRPILVLSSYITSSAVEWIAFQSLPTEILHACLVFFHELHVQSTAISTNLLSVI